MPKQFQFQFQFQFQSIEISPGWRDMDGSFNRSGSPRQGPSKRMVRGPSFSWCSRASEFRSPSHSRPSETANFSSCRNATPRRSSRRKPRI